MTARRRASFVPRDYGDAETLEIHREVVRAVERMDVAIDVSRKKKPRAFCVEITRGNGEDVPFIAVSGDTPREVIAAAKRAWRDVRHVWSE